MRADARARAHKCNLADAMKRSHQRPSSSDFHLDSNARGVRAIETETERESAPSNLCESYLFGMSLVLADLERRRRADSKQTRTRRRRRRLKLELGRYLGSVWSLVVFVVLFCVFGRRSFCDCCSSGLCVCVDYLHGTALVGLERSLWFVRLLAINWNSLLCVGKSTFSSLSVCLDSSESWARARR